MSKNKGFSNTSAQRYSLALYELSSEADSLKVVEQNVLAILKLIQTSKDFYNLIKDPTENQENFILVINKISEDLAKNFSSKIKLNYKHDKNLIGGLILKIGSTMVDTSIKNKLKQIENKMIEA